MANIILPSSLRIKHIDWSLDRPAQVNRSAYTGTRAVVANPWHGMWRAKVQLAAEQNQTNILAWKAFLAKLKGQINTFQLPATESAQHTLGTGTATSGAAQGATSIAISNSPVYGSELFTNGNFAGGTTGWTAGTSTSLTVTSGILTCGKSATDSNWPTFASSGVSVTTGQQYTLSWTNFSDSPTAPLEISIGTGAFGTSLLTPTSVGTSASGSYTWTATTTGTVFFNFQINVGVSTSFTIDNLSCKQILSTGIPPLVAGMLATVTLPSGNSQLVMLTANISGSTITFEPPLREAILTGAAVDHANPTAPMALASSDFAWSVDPGTLYSFAFDAEEAF